MIFRAVSVVASVDVVEDIAAVDVVEVATMASSTRATRSVVFLVSFFQIWKDSHRE